MFPTVREKSLSRAGKAENIVRFRSTWTLDRLFSSTSRSGGVKASTFSIPKNDHKGGSVYPPIPSATSWRSGRFLSTLCEAGGTHEEGRGLQTLRWSRGTLCRTRMTSPGQSRNYPGGKPLHTPDTQLNEGWGSIFYIVCYKFSILNNLSWGESFTTK